MNFNIKKVKIVITVPKENTKEVRDALCKAGAGVIGNYTFCTTTTKTTGTFLPNEKANPYIGRIGQLEIIEEEKLEVICDIDKAKEVVKTIRKVHPYEEPAIDIYPLLEESDL